MSLSYLCQVYSGFFLLKLIFGDLLVYFVQSLELLLDYFAIFLVLYAFVGG